MLENDPQTNRLTAACRRHDVGIEELLWEQSVEIDQNSWGVFRGPSGDVSTGGLGPCCGMAIFDRRSQLAIIGHFTDVDVDAHAIDAMLRFVADVSTNPRDLLVAVAGIAPLPEAGRDPIDAERMRETMLAKIVALGIERPEINTYWSSPHISASIETFLDTGTIQILEIAHNDDPNGDA